MNNLPPETPKPYALGGPPQSFRQMMEHYINYFSLENGSDTPDFILAEYLQGCLDNFDKTLARREKWYGRDVHSKDVKSFEVAFASGVRQYRKKPVVIEAIQFVKIRTIAHTYSPREVFNDEEICSFVGQVIRLKTSPGDTPLGVTTLEIPTLEGVVTAQVGDWIIKGVKGECYPCKPDIFETTYEAVEL